jgi:hypothetical protein
MPAGDHLSQARSIQPKHTGLDKKPSFIESEWEVRSDAQVDARFHFRAGIPSLVPWLVVSGATASGSV